jgi:dihydrofolate synthase/folylpolyglutamate synthase
MDPLAYLFSLETLGVKFGLETIRALVAALDHPERAYARVLVAGTNGKGSVTVMTETALRAAGHRVARYTSPHLQRLEERFVIDGRPVESDALAAAAETVRVAVDRLLARGVLERPPTFFEATTAVAFEVFRQARVEVAVLEVGMGGRLDATNVSPAPAVAITNIDLDHEQYLGHTIAAIAREKAGVIHRGTTVVLGDANPEVVAVVEDACRARGARLVRTSAVAVADARLEPDGRARVELRTARRRYPAIVLGLRGRHQVDNAVTAAVLLEVLDESGLAVPAAAVETGLRRAVWPGRLELYRCGDQQVLLDGAHNPAGARALAAYLRAQYPAGVPIVFAAMRDKDVAGMLAALAPAATRFVLTTVQTPRTLAVERLAEAARTVAPAVPHEVVAASAAALDRALETAPVVCVAGSLFLVGEVRGVLEARGATTVP